MKFRHYIYVIILILIVYKIIDSNTKSSVIIQISHSQSNPQSALLGLTNANNLAKSKHKVLVYFDLEGVKLLTKDAPILEYPGLEPSNKLIKKLLKNKAVIMVNSNSLSIYETKTNELISGVMIQNDEVLIKFAKNNTIDLKY